MYLAGSTMAEIARVRGGSVEPIRRILKSLGVARRPAKRRPGIGCGRDNSQWKGGRRVRDDGYVLVWTPDGERLEHRVVMESKLGRRLHACEVVHHLDRNKGNNHPDNLVTMTQREHAALHAPEMHEARYGK